MSLRTPIDSNKNNFSYFVGVLHFGFLSASTERDTSSTPVLALEFLSARLPIGRVPRPPCRGACPKQALLRGWKPVALSARWSRRVRAYRKPGARSAQREDAHRASTPTRGAPDAKALMAGHAQ